MTTKNVIITGISGQDGAYLTKLLLANDYNVIGTTRSYSSDTYKKLNLIDIDLNKVIIEVVDLIDYSSILRLFEKYNPIIIFNLAAQSSVYNSFQQPIGTIDFNVKSTLNLLEIIRQSYRDTILYQAVSSEMYGDSTILPITEESILNPKSPYAISKAAAYWLVKLYRESYNLKVCSGILFNHESILRDSNFFIKKLIENAVKLKMNIISEIILGNLNIRRDFGYSPKYVEAMYKMVSQKSFEDFIICSGKSLLLNDIVEYVFKKLEIDISNLVIDKNLYRPSEIFEIFGDNSKAKKLLNWEYNIDFYNVIDEMISYELNLYRK